MRYRRRLRSRIILSFLLLGFGLTTAFALFTVVLRARMENQLIEDWLRREVASFTDFKRENPAPDAPYQFSERDIRVSTFRPTSPNVPMEWRALGTGVYDLADPEQPGRKGRYKLAVDRHSDIVSFIRYDYAQETLDLQQLLVLLGASVVLFTVLAWVVGIWSSQRVIRPVVDLARRVRAFSGREQPEKLGPRFVDDEVGQLAGALDDYAERLTELVERDREFNADVSHELRTPLAVIRGAAELLLGQPELNDKMRQRLLRIERAEQQCTHLITALLMLSRSERGSGATDLRKLADQLAESNRVQLGAKPVAIRVEGDGLIVDAPEAVVSVALGNLFGNACKYTLEGEVLVRIQGDCVYIEDTGPGLSAEDAARLFERGYRGSAAGGTKGGGIGLSIVSRLCTLYDWTLSIAPRGGRGTVATLCFR